MVVVVEMVVEVVEVEEEVLDRVLKINAHQIEEYLLLVEVDQVIVDMVIEEMLEVQEQRVDNKINLDNQDKLVRKDLVEEQVDQVTVEQTETQTQVLLENKEVLV
jgi:hypothetical protein